MGNNFNTGNWSNNGNWGNTGNIGNTDNNGISFARGNSLDELEGRKGEQLDSILETSRFSWPCKSACLQDRV